MQRIPPKKQLWVYVHPNEYKRLKFVADKRQRRMSEVLRGVLYEWLNQHDIPYMDEKQEK
jgi:hypothetical protein